MAATAVRMEASPYAYGGIYATTDAAGYLLAGLPRSLQQRRRPTPRALHEWIRAGLIAQEQRTWPRRDGAIDFDDLVSCQVITLLRQHRALNLAKIRAAERYCASHFLVEKPFAHRDFWFSATDILGALGADYANVISGVHQGQMGWQRHSIPGLAQLRQHLTFDSATGRPVEWEPPEARGITLTPDVQFGHPCLKDTSIPTSALWSYVEGGDSEAFVAASYGIEESRVRLAVAWERQVRRELAASALSD